MTTTDSKGALVRDLLDRMVKAVEGGDLQSLRDIITDALTAKVHHLLTKMPEFQENFGSLAAHAATQGDERFVFALAELGRLHRSIRTNGSWLSLLAAQMLSNATPTSFQYGDGDQRHHAANSVLASGVPIDPLLLARAVVEEEKGERARRVWAKVLLERVPLSKVFESLALVLAEVDGTSGDSRSLRLQRILEALNDQFIRADFRIDGSLCDGFRHFIVKAFANVPRPTGVHRIVCGGGGAGQDGDPANSLQIQAWRRTRFFSCGIIGGTMASGRGLGTPHRVQHRPETATPDPSRGTLAAA